ncbi:MAG: LysM peptidoglycan-binding domain-containing protein [Ardenticatenaceae bacterium]|nr:LysM peptidoglycan-binding domain-containing protein [Anaerolineales bacterium]MCB8941089.1 LysM peptidoglycan-binding domain-containing protein [Ardenticatenaceae bacterium]MCB8972430.1 LysM peptidoglycan-binding domain-containing protein [Ardenticatenaceae bacterium]
MRRLILIFTAVCLLLVACDSGSEELITPSATAVPTPTPQIGVSFATRAAPTVAVIQTTPTPLPTPTATPTPTPIVYQIVSGDTILGIAIQRGTTVEQILALNPGIVPENLQIGQGVILPPPPTVNPLLAPGTAVPIQVVVTKIHAYQTPVGSLWLLGEVTNEGETAVENIQVEIGLLAADGRLLGSVPAWVATAIIPPGARGPFGVLLNEPPTEFAEGNAAQPSVAIIGGQAVVELGTRTLDVTVAGDALTTDDDTVSVAGTIVNEGDTAVTQIQLTATFYDAQGNVTGFQQQVLAEVLGVGEERPFQLQSAPPGGTTVAYTLHAEAQTVSSNP